MRGILSSITYLRHDASEGFCHSILHTPFLAAGIFVIGEVPGGLGRSDMAVFLKDRVGVAIELKYRHADLADDDDALAAKELAAALDDAEKQIRSR